MKTNYYQLTAGAALLLAFSAAAYAQKAPGQLPLVPVETASDGPAPAPVYISWNDKLVMHTMRTINSAQIAYQATSGNGTFGDLAALGQAGLIDTVTAAGIRHGYRFSIRVRHTSVSAMGGFDLTATPVVRRPRDLSFYMDESCMIRGADHLGQPATVDDPVIETCGVSQLAENERLAMASLRTIHSAEMTYASTYGAGEYATLSQLWDLELNRTGFVLAFIYRGYIVSSMTVTPSTVSTPARFTLSVVPQQHNRSGKRSFFINEDGVIRGGDKNGAPATADDPPIVD